MDSLREASADPAESVLAALGPACRVPRTPLACRWRPYILQSPRPHLLIRNSRSAPDAVMRVHLYPAAI